MLGLDVASRLGTRTTWQSIIEVVQEWQALLAPRPRLSPERELGLWGELWFLDRALDLDRLLAGWRGPDADSTDFFIAGVAVDLKASRKARVHHLSQAQVDAPAGKRDAWLLSLHVKQDPAAQTSVGFLANRIIHRAADKVSALQRLAQAGFSLSERRQYSDGFTLLAAPEWFHVDDVPRVRKADPGVTDLRYRAVLDAAHAAAKTKAKMLFNHFHGCQYEESSDEAG